MALSLESEAISNVNEVTERCLNSSQGPPARINFLIADWVVASPLHILTVPKTLHSRTSPTSVQVWKDKGSDIFEDTPVSMTIDDITKDVVLTLNELPDLRFDGFVSIG